jgi:hypothetical protein
MRISRIVAALVGAHFLFSISPAAAQDAAQKQQISEALSECVRLLRESDSLVKYPVQRWSDKQRENCKRLRDKMRQMLPQAN